MEDRKKESAPENLPPSKPSRPDKSDGGQPPEAHEPQEGDEESQAPSNNGNSEGQNQAPMVALSMEEFDALQDELEKTRTKCNEYFDGWQHERADFLNYKKRIDRDAASVQQNAVASVVKKYLIILDDLERALKTRPASSEGATWADGFELINRKLITLLEQEGVRRMEAEKENFDPRRHEAIMQEESPDHESGQIIEVIQQGYLLGDRVIRPALVRVAK
jgi:molecular chaperone GrpE